MCFVLLVALSSKKNTNYDCQRSLILSLLLLLLLLLSVFVSVSVCVCVYVGDDVFGFAASYNFIKTIIVIVCN